MVITERHLIRWSFALLAVSGVLAAVGAVVFLTLRFGEHHDVFRYFHLGSEGGLGAFYNAALLALVSAAAALSGLLAGPGKIRRSWLAVGVVALYMALDEATRIHERTAALVTDNPLPTFAWVVIGIPLAILLVALLWFVTRPLPTTLRRGLGIALLIYLLGALGFEAIGGYFYGQQRPRVYIVLMTIEELLEMAACILAAHLIVRAWLPLRLTQRDGLGSRVRAAADTERAAPPPESAGETPIPLLGQN